MALSLRFYWIINPAILNIRHNEIISTNKTHHPEFRTKLYTA